MIYDTWVYENILNKLWFIWTIVIIIFVANVLMPVILWFLIGGRSIVRKSKS